MAIFLATLSLTCVNGCATFGRRGGPSPEKLAACREFSHEGMGAMEAGQWKQAAALFEQALDEAPNDPEAHRHLAEALWHQGATKDALSHIDTALRLQPGDANLIVLAGEMTVTAGDYNAALLKAEEAIRLNPQLAAAWALRGRVFRHQNQPDRALADLQRALEFAPERSDVLMDVAAIYRERKQPARSLATLHRLHDVCPPGKEPQSALIMEGLTLMDLGRPQQAAQVLIAASDRAPPNAELLFYVAQAQSAAGNYSGATLAAEQALAVDASHQASRQLLAQLAAHAAPTDPHRR